MPEGAASGDARGIFGVTCVRLTARRRRVARMCQTRGFLPPAENLKLRSFGGAERPGRHAEAAKLAKETRCSAA